VTVIADIIKFLKRHRGRYVFSLLIRDLVFLAISVFGLLTILQIVFAGFPWTVLPLAWDISIIGFFTAAVIFVIDKFFIRKPPLLRIASRIEERLRLKPRWISLALELSSPKSPGSEQLKDEVTQLALRQIKNQSFSIRCKIPVAIALLLAFALLTWSGVTLLLTPRISSFWDLPLTMGAHVRARITPGSVTLPQSAAVTLGCLPTTKAYPSCKVVLKDNSDGMMQTLLLRPDSSGCFGLRRDSISRSFIYQFSLGTTVFPAETISVLPPPSLSGLRVRIVPPAYVGMRPTQLAEGQGNFSAYLGAVAQFSIGAPHALSHAFLRSSVGDSVSFSVTGRQAIGEIVIRNKCGYSFSLTDTLGQRNDSLPQFSIDITPDMPPLVQILKPGNNKELSPALVETLWVEAADDIGLRQCALKWRKNSEPRDTIHSKNLLSIGRIDKNLRIQHIWDIGPCSLYPGDTLFYWVYARDNAPVDAGHSCVSPTFWFRLPTFEEIHQRIAEEQNSTENSLDAAQKKEETIRGALTNLMKSTKGKESLTWEQKQIAKDLEENFRAQSDTIAKAALSLKRTIEKLKEQGFSSKDIIDKMENIRKALEELVRDYGDSLLFEPLHKNEKAVSADDLKESLEKFQKMLPDLSKRLDNAFKFLEMLKKDRRLAALAAAAEKYGKEELSLAAENPAGPQQLEMQKTLTEKTDNLLSELSRESDKKNDSALFSKGDVSSFEEVQSMQQAIKNSLSKKGMPETAMRNRMSAGLLSLSRELSDLQSSAMMKKLAHDKELLMEMSHDALSMAQWQKQIRDELGTRDNNSTQSQQALRQATMTSAEKLNKLSMTSPQLLRNFMKQYDTVAGAMELALEFLKNDRDDEGPMNQCMENVNSLAFSLLQAANSMDGGQGEGEGSGEMMCGLQKLSGKQAMVNGLTGEILRRMLGENGSQGEEGGQGEGAGASNQKAEKARKQAQEAEQSIADGLRKLAQKYGKDAENGLGKKAQDLEEEARRLSRMLENPRPEIRDRQDRFLSQMLQSALSMHKQQEGKEERKSHSAKDVFSSENEQINEPISNDRDTFFRIRQKAFSGNVPECYRQAIKSYFDSLSVLYLREK
jgi:hypothetical protein